MYQVICLLIDAPTEEEFTRLLQSFRQEFGSVSSAYWKYFETTFLPKSSKWAMCFRKDQHGDVDTTMHVESFHNVLKTVYMERRPTKRLDKLIDFLKDIEEDYYARHKDAVQLETLYPDDVRKIRLRHDNGKKIKDEDVCVVSTNTYLVKSQDKNKSEEYSVFRCSSKCEEEICVYKCPTCVICSHIYTCSCPDLSPLCKHIHKVHLLFFASKESSLNSSTDDHEPEFFDAENLEEALNHTESVASNVKFTVEKKLVKIKEIMKEVENQLENSPVKRFMLSRIQNVLSDLHVQCKTLTEHKMKEQPVPEMDKQVIIGPNEKIKTQIQPFKRVKKAKKKGLQRPNKKSAEEIKKFLFQDDGKNVDDVLVLSDTEDDGRSLFTIVSTDSNVESHEDNFIVKTYEGYKLTRLHFLSIKANLNDAEMKLSHLFDNNFRPGWLYDEVINVFFKLLELSNGNMYACDSTVAQSLLLQRNFKTLNLKLKDKSLILFPANISGDHWTAAAVSVDSKEIIYYNPLSETGSCLSPGEQKLISSIMSFIRDSFPCMNSWTLRRHYDVQQDGHNCGVHVCWFGYQVATSQGGTMPPLLDPDLLRLEIYDTFSNLP